MRTQNHACVIGGKGFVGQQLIKQLSADGWSCYLPERGDPNIFSKDLGHVFYCAGLTADFRERPFATVEAHVTLLASMLERSHFTSLTYCSSTRVYSGAVSTREDAPLSVAPQHSGDLYNLSKLMGESLCLHAGRPARVVRLSNVYGKSMPEKNFLESVLSEAKKTGSVLFHTSPDSEKDYISVSEVARLLPKIATHSEFGITNLASGQNISHQQIADLLAQKGVTCRFALGAPSIRFPKIDVSRLEKFFGLPQFDFKTDLLDLYQ